MSLLYKNQNLVLILKRWADHWVENFDLTEDRRKINKILKIGREKAGAIKI